MTDRAPIFDPGERTQDWPCRHGEPTSSFLNRIAGPFWDDVRQLIQSWADHVEKDEDYRDLAGRLADRNDQQYEAALLELTVHESLLRSGHQVEIHPEIPGKSARPDFRAIGSSGPFYVEVISPGLSGAALVKKNRVDRFLDTINDLGDQNFLLQIVHLDAGPNDARGAAARRDIARWLSGLDPDEPRERSEAHRHVWRDQGWVLIVAAIALPAKHRGPQDRSIGVYSHYPVASARHGLTVRKALAAKRSKYGNLGAPFVIVCGIDFRDTHDWHVTGALLGREEFTYVQDSDEEEVRRVGGFFGSPGDWQATRVSAVVIANRVKPQQLHTGRIDTWIHPAAEFPLGSTPFLPEARKTWDGEHLATGSRANITEFFGLPDPWPRHEPWPD